MENFSRNLKQLATEITHIKRKSDLYAPNYASIIELFDIVWNDFTNSFLFLRTENSIKKQKPNRPKSFCTAKRKSNNTWGPG